MPSNRAVQGQTALNGTASEASASTRNAKRADVAGMMSGMMNGTGGGMDPAALHAFMEQRRRQLAESPLAQQVGQARLLGYCASLLNSCKTCRVRLRRCACRRCRIPVCWRGPCSRHQQHGPSWMATHGCSSCCPRLMQCADYSQVHTSPTSSTKGCHDGNGSCHAESFG